MPSSKASSPPSLWNSPGDHTGKLKTRHAPPTRTVGTASSTGRLRVDERRGFVWSEWSTTLLSSFWTIDDSFSIEKRQHTHHKSQTDEHTSAFLALVRLRREVSKVHTGKNGRWATHTPSLLHAPSHTPSPYRSELQATKTTPASRSVTWETKRNPASQPQSGEPTKPKGKRFIGHQRLNPKNRPSRGLLFTRLATVPDLSSDNLASAPPRTELLPGTSNEHQNREHIAGSWRTRRGGKGKRE